MRELKLTDVLCKTPAGRREQQQRSSALGARQRHVLILCDGRRPLRELCALMGDGATALAQELLSAGYVETSRAQQEATHDAESLAPSAVPATQLAQAVAPPSRRSIALSRMDMFDMIERSLGHQSGPARAHLRAAEQTDALLSALQDCLLLIAEVAGPAQADKVRAQLCTMLPEDWVGHFESMQEPRFEVTS